MNVESKFEYEMRIEGEAFKFHQIWSGNGVVYLWYLSFF